ncbi:MAG TPA: hypothetical protein VE325_09550 [Burkholderiales bacterium]|nr:hypothetical protein [Burkholderiales bacterium]
MTAMSPTQRLEFSAILDLGPALDQGGKWAKLFDENFVPNRP